MTTQQDTIQQEESIPPIEQSSSAATSAIAMPPPTSQPQSPVQLRQPLLSPVLRGALFSAKDRTFIIGLEKDLLTFITSHTDSYLLRPMNSYYRLLTHQTAEYYGLGHSLNKEGNSIVVYKNFGSDPTPPLPLASIPFDPQFIAIQAQQQQAVPPQPPLPLPLPQHQQQQNQQQQQQFIYQQGGPGASGGPIPLGYGFAAPFGYPQFVQQPQQQQPFNKGNYAGNRYQPRHYNNHKHNNNTNNSNQPDHQRQPQHEQPQYQQKPQQVTEKVASSSSVDEAGEESKPPASATTQIKLMKRSDSTKEDEESDEKSGEEVSNKSVNEEREADQSTKKDAEALAVERATRESEYQKARERIFENGEDEIDEDLVDDLDHLSIKPNHNNYSNSNNNTNFNNYNSNSNYNNYNNQSPTFPRSLPSQPQHPYGGGSFIPTNIPQFNTGAIPQQQYYFNQGYPQMVMYDPSAYGAQPVYYNQAPFNAGGHRKKHYNNGYRNNRNNSHNNYNNNNYSNNYRNGGNDSFKEKEVLEDVGGIATDQNENGADGAKGAEGSKDAS